MAKVLSPTTVLWVSGSGTGALRVPLSCLTTMRQTVGAEEAAYLNLKEEDRTSTALNQTQQNSYASARPIPAAAAD